MLYWGGAVRETGLVPAALLFPKATAGDVMLITRIQFGSALGFLGRSERTRALGDWGKKKAVDHLIAFDERRKIHDLLMEDVELALKKRGYPTLADMKATWQRKER
ncbi:MAG: hypothetical protein WA728_11465 [Xanthobacteraceae bacterium]